LLWIGHVLRKDDDDDDDDNNNNNNNQCKKLVSLKHDVRAINQT